MAIREASLLGHYATPPADGDRRVPGACRETGAPWGPEPRRPDVSLIRLCRGEYRPPGNGHISRDVSLYIRAHGRGGVLQGGGNSNVQRARSERFTGIYRTTQFDNTVQDTERSPHDGVPRKRTGTAVRIDDR